jgi:alpha-galactosidase
MSPLSPRLSTTLPLLVQAEYRLGDLLVRYVAPDDRPDAWGLMLLPLAKASAAVTPHEWLDSPAIRGLPPPWNRTRAWEVDPLVHAHVAGDPYPGGYAQGRTLRNSATTQSLAVRAHTREVREGRTLLRTTLADAGGRLACIHKLSVDETTGTIEVHTSAQNAGDHALTLEFLSSFSLGGITPFAADDASGQLRVHRFRSTWSAEGRHEVRTLEELQLERSWTGHGVRSERFGQVGSLPVNGWFPFVALEDATAGVTWAAQLACPGTWQTEIYRRADQLALGGGGSDRLAGEWRKTLQPGETVSAPPAFLTVVMGGIDDACDRLLAAQRRGAVARPAIEDELPVIFNEWCTFWGRPTHDSLVSRIGWRIAACVIS